jgi:hypothetical protein
MVGKGTSFLDWDILKARSVGINSLWNVTNDKYNAGVRMVIKKPMNLISLLKDA